MLLSSEFYHVQRVEYSVEKIRGALHDFFRRADLELVDIL